MTTKTILSVLSGIIFIYAYYPYVKAIIRRKTKPRKATWLVWTISDIITLSGMLSKNTFSWLILSGVIGGLITFVASLKYGEPGWNRTEKIGLALSAVAIVLWMYFDDSNWGIFFSLTTIYASVWPTFVSAWKKPTNEDKEGWVWFALSSFLAVLAIPQASFADIAPPFVFLSVDVVLLYLLFIRPKITTTS